MVSRWMRDASTENRNSVNQVLPVPEPPKASLNPGDPIENSDSSAW